MDDVLIVGAGPTGLVLALWLTKQGVRVRIIDKSDGPGETSRAMAVQARTLELYRQMGIADAVVAAGHKNPAMNLWVRGKKKARLIMGEAGMNLTPYPFILVYPQDEHERFLVNKLQEAGIVVERQTELVSFEDKGTHIVARVKGPDGETHFSDARYLAGCDGARSPVRHALGNEFEGGTYKHVFYVADVELEGLNPSGEIHIALDSSDFAAVLSYGNNQNRLIGIISDERTERAETLTFDDIGHQAIERMGVKVKKVHWFSTYRVHHRVTNRFRLGRVFLAGDAAHVHSPAGGQGMNTGISDAINLAWKLAAVVKGEASDSLLDSYDTERRKFARQLVETTDRIFTFVTKEGNLANFVRTHIAPIMANVVYRFDSAREMIFRMISQTSLSYGDSMLSEGNAGSINGGNRLPWVRSGMTDNYASLEKIGWQIHVYGAPKTEIKRWCELHHVPLHVFAWQPDHLKAGLCRDATYLLRPDTYIALADPSGSASILTQYFSSRGITLKGQD